MLKMMLVSEMIAVDMPHGTAIRVASRSVELMPIYIVD